MTVIVERDDGDFDRTRRLGLGRFEQAVRREFTRRGGLRPCLQIVRKLFVALADRRILAVIATGARRSVRSVS